MKLRLKLFATLSDYLPQPTRGNEVEVEVNEGATVAQVIEQFHLPPKLVHLVLLNGTFVPQEQRESTSLSDGDALAVWPPVAGG